ncbi:hypothetical protein OAO18_04335 [Francisellaceae bacterium]|nr:hypothetical protein [Francisellaceae bacterium]
MIDNVLRDHINFLNGKWIGNWGERENITVIIKSSGINLTGSYEIDNQSIKFSGSVRKENDQIIIKFDPPMEPESGGEFDIDTKKLYLYCTSSSGYFKKIN